MSSPLPERFIWASIGPTNKLMRIVREPLTWRVLFWLVIIVLYEVMEFRAFRRWLRFRVYEGTASTRSSVTPSS